MTDQSSHYDINTPSASRVPLRMREHIPDPRLTNHYSPLLSFTHLYSQLTTQGKRMGSFTSIVSPWTLSFQESGESIKDDSIGLDKMVHPPLLSSPLLYI